MFTVVAVAGLAGCAGSSAGQGAAGAVPLSSQQVEFSAGQQLAQTFAQAKSPDKCNKTVHVHIKGNGGSFTVPLCSGWSGTITYPAPAAPRLHYPQLLTSSVTNNFGVPAPPSGTAVFYMEEKPQQHGVQFSNPSPGVTNTITSPSLSSNHTYTLLVYYFASDPQCSNPSQGCPPWVANIGSPAPSTHSITFTSPLNGALLSTYPVVWQFVQN
jgi:hypothetical protein